MALTDLPLLGMLKTKMQWHQARQTVLANNVANADTPRFRPSELEQMDARQALKQPQATMVKTATTHAAHIAGPAMSAGTAGLDKDRGWETTPAGNSVVLEEQMMKVSANQFDFQMASSLYAKSLGLLKSAVGRGS